MSPHRLLQLVTRALGRTPRRAELEDWADVLRQVQDDDADAGLTTHRASSPHSPTPADVRRQAVVIANDRAMRAEAEARRLERETGRTIDGQPFVPMPDEVKQASAHLAARQRDRDAALSSGPEMSGPTEPPRVSTPTWPCCPHCTGTDDPIGHPPHRTPCDQCTDTPASTVTLDTERPAGAP
jgi:hypothetical protein